MLVRPPIVDNIRVHQEYLYILSSTKILAKTLDQTVPEYLKETLLEALTYYAASDMITDILEREL
jgi:hypothetical protein